MQIFAFPKQYEQKQLQAFEMTLTWILTLYIARVYDLKVFTTWLWSQLPSPSSFFTQVSFNTGKGFPFQAQTSFFHTWTICVLFCCQTTEGWVINALVPALFVQQQWLNLCSHFQQSCKKKEIIPSSVNSWHTRSRRFPNHHATSSRTHTKHYSFTSSVIYHLAPASEEMVITLENLGIAFLGSI